MRNTAVVIASTIVMVSLGLAYGQGQSAAPPLPMPTFHHIRINSVDPEKSLAWYAQYWPQGKKTTLAGLPAFSDEKGFYLIYQKVAKQAPGGFDRTAQRSVPQSAFWTFGSTFAGPDLT